MTTTQYPPAAPPQAPPPGYPQYPPQGPPPAAYQPQYVAPQKAHSWKLPAIIAGTALVAAGAATAVTMALTGSTTAKTITPGPQQFASQFVGLRAADGTHITKATAVPGTEASGSGVVTELATIRYSDGTQYVDVIWAHAGKLFFNTAYQR
jgi:hypothetical protein